LYSACLYTDLANALIYPLSLHDALPICGGASESRRECAPRRSRSSIRAQLLLEPSVTGEVLMRGAPNMPSQIRVTFRFKILLSRSEEHTSELQSRFDLVCRLLLEKKKKP